jgi:tRNA-2-methylthio-N6-dimethylallyladenosine synthase
VDGIERIRFMTSHPKDLSEELMCAMAELPKMCHHLHLPVQSGSDRILKAMNRGYTKEKYLSLAMKAKELMPDLCMTSDIIVGFPGEQYEDFLETMDLVKKVGYSALFTFVFSPRKGTPAAEMEDVISAKEKSAWFQELLKVQEELAAEVTADYEGKTFRVLCEGMNEKGFYTGRTQGNILVEFSGKPEYINQFVHVTITETLSFVLKGEVR